MSKKILITGGSGLIGRNLTELLESRGDRVSWLTRKVDPAIERIQYVWNVNSGEIDPSATLDKDIIIHLAGESVGGQRWNKKYKKTLWDSRVRSTELLHRSCDDNNQFPTQFISGSAIGYYGYDRADNELTETESRGSGFLADLTVAWEKSAIPFGNAGVKTAWIRTGLVFSKTGGALEQMARPIRLGFGSALGSGSQFQSWIHLHDEINAIVHILDHELTGVFNLTAPFPNSNQEISKSIATVLNKPFFFPNVPGFALQLVLGEFSKSVLGSLRVVPQRLLDSGFEFRFPELDPALKDLFNNTIA